MNQACIFIPTHERHAYLKRSIAYYRHFSLDVVVCDSSEEPYDGVMPGNFSYQHMPGRRFAEKIAMASRVVNHDMIALSPDDDFILESALQKGISALTHHSSCQACVGEILAFQDAPPFKIIARCADGAAARVTGSPGKDIEQYLSNYHQVLWSLFRKDVLKTCFEGLEQVRFGNDNFIELLLATICSGLGGIHYIRAPWILREVTQKDHWGARHSPLTFSSCPPTNSDVKKFIEFVDEALFAGAGEQALQAYLQSREKAATPPDAWARVSEWPSRIWNKVLSADASAMDAPQFKAIRDVLSAQEMTAHT